MSERLRIETTGEGSLIVIARPTLGPRMIVDDDDDEL